MASAPAEPMPLVSVIIPTFNRPAFLQQAIQSVLVQTYSTFEILVIDDGSSQDTRAVMEAITDRRIHYLWQENAGRSSARNRGLALARGDYVTFLDDDDLYLPHKLAEQVQYLQTHLDADLVSSGTQMVDEHGRLIRTWHTWEDQPDLSLPACLYACPLPTCAVMLRRQCLDALDRWFDPEMDRAEDTDFFIRLLLAGCRAAWLRAIVSAYRFHAGNSQGDGVRYSRSHRRLLDKLYSQEELPEAVRAERDRLYAHYYLMGACNAYAAGQTDQGQADMEEALALRPDLMTGHPAPLATAVAAFAASFCARRPHAFINIVFDAVRPVLGEVRDLRASSHSAFHMRRVFSAHRAGRRIPLTHWLRGIVYDPRWLRNRGAWAVLKNGVMAPTRPH